MFIRMLVWQFLCEGCGYWQVESYANTHRNCPQCQAGPVIQIGSNKKGKTSSIRNTKPWKDWFLSKEAGFDGNGQTVPCFWCRRSLDFGLITVDHWPIPSRDGGPTSKENLVPACLPCNSRGEGNGQTYRSLPANLPKTFRFAKLRFDAKR